ncbi:MAG: desulfoferrodoxin [Planctomycetota bacterium]
MTATKPAQIYKCDLCGNIVEVLHGGSEALVCCGENMKLQTTKTEDKGAEKHVPECSVVDGKLQVQVGSTPHPMEDEHFIEWVEVLTEDAVQRVHLKPGQDPKAIFPDVPTKATVREFCNVHGHWETSFTS